MTSIPRTYYVYVLARPNGAPFYVGKGSGRRMFDHEKEARAGHKCHKCNVIRKIWRSGGQVQYFTVLETPDEQEAFDTERALIALHGRKALANLTDGGEGTAGRVLSLETRERLAALMRGKSPPNKGKPLPLEMRAHLSRKLKGHPASLEGGKRLAAFNRGRKGIPHSREHTDNAALGQTGGRTYTIVSPAREYYHNVPNLRAFEREHNIPSGGLQETLKGRTTHARGWTLWVGDTPPEGFLFPESYAVTAPSGVVYRYVWNFMPFGEEHGLGGHELRAMARRGTPGRRGRYRGWSIAPEDRTL